MMDVGTIVKLVVVIPAAIGIINTLYKISIERKDRLRVEYEFANKFLKDIETKNISPYLLEKGYQAIAGTNAVKASEIKYILSLKNPGECLNDFVFSKQLFEEI